MTTTVYATMLSLPLLAASAYPFDVHASDPANGRIAYVIADKVTMRDQPPDGPENSVTTASADEIEREPGLPFGVELRVLRFKGDWLEVDVRNQRPDPKLQSHGWLHRSAVTSSEAAVERIRSSGVVPKTILAISSVERRNTYHVDLAAGTIPATADRALLSDGHCVSIDDTAAARKAGGVSLGPMGPEQVINPSADGELYCYSAKLKKVVSLATLAGIKEPVVAIAKDSTQDSRSDASKAPAPRGAFPAYTEELRGTNPVRVENPNDFAVEVGLRCGTKGKDFEVGPASNTTIHVPNGSYEIYFWYSTDQTGLYRGDDFKLDGQGVAIRIVKVVNGNYGIRKVR